MFAVGNKIKNFVEEFGGLRIYRHTLPHGVDCFADLQRRLRSQSVSVVFDVGANRGQSALEYLQKFPNAEIYCFEPVAATFQALQAATSNSRRVHAYQLGMGEAVGETTISANPEATLSSIKLKLPDGHSEPIRLDTIAKFAENNSIETIDFLKIDTEGYEMEVLRGAESLLKLQRIRLIFIECEPVERFERFTSFSKLADYLGGFGYRLFGIYDQSFAPSVGNSICYCNVLFACDSLTSPKQGPT